MFKQSTLMLVAFVLLGASACKKEETKVTLKDQLVGKVWKSTALKVNGTNQSAWCWLNSLWEFTSAGNFYYTQGDNLGACSGANIGDIFSSPYAISADEKYIIRVSSSPSEQDTLEVVSINSTELHTKRAVNKDTPSPDTWEDTFTAQ